MSEQRTTDVFCLLVMQHPWKINPSNFNQNAITFLYIWMNLYKSKVKDKHCSQTFDLPYFHQQKLHEAALYLLTFLPAISCFKIKWCRLTFHSPVMSWSDICVNQGSLRGERPIRGGEIVRRVKIPSAHQTTCHILKWQIVFDYLNVFIC